jgi:thiamine-monophosphate kinase
VIDARSVPLSKAARTALVDDSRCIATVLTGGDDYEILFTASPAAVDQVCELSRMLGVPITAIGQMHSAETKERPITILAGDAEIDNLDRVGWTHF